MAVKYIQKNKNGLWAISNSKTGKALRTTNTQKEAIAIAGSQKTTEGIMIKRTSGWTQATGWDQQIANSTKSATTLKEEKGVTTKKTVAKKPAVKKPVTKKPTVKKAAPKKAAPKAEVKKEVVAAPVKEAKKETKAPVKKTKAIEPKVEKVEDKELSNKKGLPGWAGLLIGLLIIGAVVGTAFILGYFL